MSKKEKFPLYLSPEKKAILERRSQEDGSRSITAFIERAVDSTSAPTTPDCFFLPPSSPIWTEGWDSWRSGCVGPGRRAMSGRIDSEKPLPEV